MLLRLADNKITSVLHRSDAAKSQKSSRAMRIAASRADPQNPTLFGRTPTAIGGLSRNNLFTGAVDDVVSVTSLRRGVRDSGAGYTRHLQLSPSDDYDSEQIGDGYTRHLRHYDNDTVSSFSHCELRSGPFGGISPSYINEFGRGPNSLLTGDAIRRNRGVDSNNDVTEMTQHGASGTELHELTANTSDTLKLETVERCMTSL